MKNEEMLKLIDDLRKDIHRELDAIKQRLDGVEAMVIKYLANRLPIWATVLFAVFTAIIGALLGKLI